MYIHNLGDYFLLLEHSNGFKAKALKRCINCGKLGHVYVNCNAPKVIRCICCGVANVLTKGCPCHINPIEKDVSRIQTLRRVGCQILRSV